MRSRRRLLAALRARGRELLRPLDRLGRARPTAAGPATRGPILAGFAIIGVFFGAVVGWAGTAPLESAAIAPGVVGFSGFRKTVQHLEGGIVREILAEDGQRVAAGQVLLRLDDTRARANLEALDAQFVATAALEARLQAEQAELSAVTFPGWLAARAGEPVVAEVMAGQRDLFAARRDALRQQLDILGQRIARYEEQARGLAGEIDAQRRELDLVVRERESIAPLAARGIVPRNRLLELDRAAARLEGGLSQNAAGRAAALQGVGELRSQRAETRARRASEVAEALRAAQERRRTLEAEVAGARDTLARTVVTAPIRGYVVDRRVHTTGGVVAPGAPLVDIVPDDAGGTLVVEARIDPRDRDAVAAGQDAWLSFAAFSQRTTARVRGTVASISADRLTDDTRAGAGAGAGAGPAATPHYYRAVVHLREDPQPALGGSALHPGMQAEVMIVTGRRTALAYLLRPLLFGMQRALRET